MPRRCESRTMSGHEREALYVYSPGIFLVYSPGVRCVHRLFEFEFIIF